MAMKKTSGKKSTGKDKKSKGGIVKGKSHKKGGEKFTVKSTGDKVELEGGEAILTKGSMEIKEEVVLEGTPKEIASQINQMGGGVPFEEECHVCSESKYEFGGIIDKDYFSEKDQDEFTKNLSSYIEGLGYETRINYSNTDFGKSNYIYVNKKEDSEFYLKIRISDHSVTNIDRIYNEEHIHFPIKKEQLNEKVNSVIDAIKFKFDREKYFTQTQTIQTSSNIIEIPEHELNNDDVIIEERLSKKGNKIYKIKRTYNIPYIVYKNNRTNGTYGSYKLYSEGGMIDKDGYIHRIGDLVHEEIGKNQYVKSVNINPIKNEISILFYEIVTIDQISELVEESVSFGKQTIFVGSGTQLRAYNFGSEWEEPEFDFKNLSVLYRLKKEQSYEAGGIIPAHVDNPDTLINPEQMNLFVPVSETITLEDFIRSNGIELELERHQFGIGTMLTSSSGTRYKVSTIRHFPGNKDSEVVLRSQKAFQEEQEYTVACTFVTMLEKFKDGSISIDGFTSSEIRELARVLFIIQQTFKTSFLRGENNSLISMIETKERIEQDSILESQREDEAARLKQSQSEKDEAEQNFDDK